METHLYRFYWLDGTTSVWEGTSVSDAFRKLGFGGGSLAALDFYEIDKPVATYFWNAKNRQWVK